MLIMIITLISGATLSLAPQQPDRGYSLLLFKELHGLRTGRGA